MPSFTSRSGSTGWARAVPATSSRAVARSVARRMAAHSTMSAPFVPRSAPRLEAAEGDGGGPLPRLEEPAGRPAVGRRATGATDGASTGDEDAGGATAVTGEGGVTGARSVVASCSGEVADAATAG